MADRLFTSPRERRLWGWTLAVVAAIFSTLAVAPKLTAILRDRNLLDNLFFAGFLLVLATIAWHGLRRRPSRVEIGVVMGVAAAYLLVFVRMSIPPEERTHLVEYGVVAIFIHEALTERASQGRRVPLPALIAIVATVAIGALDEAIQAFVPNRAFDPRDLLFNVAAAVMAVAAATALAWARRRASA
ncbi:MAG: VanZ family protein [Thermoanaerobaculia bacterium]|nr:VanZ family protein [Thermoanaerobaculia bacterium]